MNSIKSQTEHNNKIDKNVNQINKKMVNNNSKSSFNNLNDKEDTGLINRIQSSMMYKTNNLFDMVHNLNSKI